MGEAEFGLYGIFRYWLTIPIGVISITLAPYVIFPFTDYCLGNIANYTHSLLFCFWFNWTMNTGVAWFVQAVVEHPVSKFWYPLSAAISASCWVFLVGFKLYPIPFGCYLLCGAASLPTSFPVLYFMIPKEVRENKKKVLIGALKLVHNTIPFVIFACVYRAIFIRLEGTSWQLPFSFVLPFMKWLWIKLGVKECPDGVGFIHGQSFIITMTYCFSSLLFIHIDEPFTFAVIMLQQNLPWIIQWRFLGWKIGHVTATVDETVKTVRSSLFSGKKKVAVGSTSTPAADVPSPITADAAAAAGGEGDAMNKKPVLRSQQSRLSVAGKGMDQSHAEKLYWNQRDFENRVIAHFYDRFIQGCVLFYNAGEIIIIIIYPIIRKDIFSPLVCNIVLI